MASVAQLNEKLDQMTAAIAAERQEVLTKLGELNQEIQTLKDQIANGPPSSQEQLDALGQRIDAAMAGISGIVKSEDGKPSEA